VAAGKVQVVPHGNFDHYVPSPRPSRAEARAALGLADDDAVALFFGYIRPYKGLDLLLDAFEAVAGAVPRARLVIAGRPHTDRDAELIHARVLTHPASSRIIFHDRYIPHREVADYFTATDLVVLPYRHIYHSGLVHLAFSFGKATVATRVGDFPEMIDVGQTGLLVPPDSASALADTLVTALSDPSALESMGARAAVVSAEEYAWPDIGARTVSVYRSF
jgi:glycosyltransferase involved in cell wall biosynthesis